MSGKKVKEEEEKKKRKQPGSHARSSAQLPQSINNIKKRDKGRNMYFIVFLQQTRGTVVFKKQH